MFSGDCSISLDGAPPIPVTPSGVNIPIAPTRESGNHSYDALSATNSRAHHRWMRRLGGGALIEDSLFEYAPAPGHRVGRRPRLVPVTMVGGDPPAVEAGPSLTTVHWKLGRFGAQ